MYQIYLDFTADCLTWTACHFYEDANDMFHIDNFFHQRTSLTDTILQ